MIPQAVGDFPSRLFKTILFPAKYVLPFGAMFFSFLVRWVRWVQWVRCAVMITAVMGIPPTAGLGSHVCEFSCGNTLHHAAWHQSAYASQMGPDKEAEQGEIIDVGYTRLV